MINNITFSIIKPDALAGGDGAAILCRIVDGGFTIAALKMLQMSRMQAERFYEAHREKLFFSELVDFMSSGPVIVMVLRHHDAVDTFRKLIGNTDPGKADPGTIRADFGSDVRRNAVHGSDSTEDVVKELSYFFSTIEIF